VVTVTFDRIPITEDVPPHGKSDLPPACVNIKGVSQRAWHLGGIPGLSKQNQLTAAHRNYPGVRCVPIPVSGVTFTSISYIGEIGRSEMISQGRESARNGHP
jgi:hypothetical protein